MFGLIAGRSGSKAALNTFGISKKRPPIRPVNPKKEKEIK
jgi:hypothetical protein